MPAIDARPPSLAHELATGICCASGDALWLEVEAPPLPNRRLHLAQTTLLVLTFDGALFFG
jgi:hypothetical protein